MSDISEPYISKPLGYSLYPKEMSPIPQSWVATIGNLVFYREHDKVSFQRRLMLSCRWIIANMLFFSHKGGHFAALERPVQFVQDIEDFVRQVWPSA